eukprot:5923762-Amphidinium_carterae.1
MVSPMAFVWHVAWLDDEFMACGISTVKWCHCEANDITTPRLSPAMACGYDLFQDSAILAEYHMNQSLRPNNLSFTTTMTWT